MGSECSKFNLHQLHLFSQWSMKLASRGSRLSCVDAEHYRVWEKKETGKPALISTVVMGKKELIKVRVLFLISVSISRKVPCFLKLKPPLTVILLKPSPTAILPSKGKWVLLRNRWLLCFFPFREAAQGKHKRKRGNVKTASFSRNAQGETAN